MLIVNELNLHNKKYYKKSTPSVCFTFNIKKYEFYHF